MAKRQFSMTHYLQPAYHPPTIKKMLRRAVPKLEKFMKTHPFDAIAFRGYSGATVAAMLSLELNVPMIAVRKTISHDYNIVFGLQSVESYIIVDDFIASGRTVKDVIESIQRWAGAKNGGKRVKVQGVFCYSPSAQLKRARKPERLGDWDRFHEASTRPYKDVPVMYL